MRLDWCMNLKGFSFYIFCLAYSDVQKFWVAIRRGVEVVKSYRHLKAVLLRKDSILVILIDIQGLEDLRASSSLKYYDTLNCRGQSQDEN